MKKKRLGKLLILGLEKGSNLAYILRKLNRIGSRYKQLQLGFLHSDEEYKDFCVAWGLDQLRAVRAGTLKVAGGYFIFRPNWHVDNPFGRVSKKRASKDRKLMIKEMSSLMEWAIFFAKDGSERYYHLYKALKKRGVHCKTIKCRPIKTKKKKSTASHH